MSRFVMSYEPDKFKIKEFLEKLQGKNAIDIVMKSIDYAEVQLEKAIIDIDIYISSLNLINRGGSIRILFREINVLKVNDTEVDIILKNYTFLKFTLI